MFNYIQKANILIEALPYIQKLSGKTIVIKYGGNAMIDENLQEMVMQDITLLKYVGMNPIVVHGGGPEINNTLEKLNIKPQFHNGLRITDQKVMDVVQMVLSGKINKEIVSKINNLGGKAIGISGKDANLIEVEKLQQTDGIDLGFVGKIKNINNKILELMCRDEYIPVIAPIGVGPDGKSYNINADTVASEIAASLNAEKLIFLTDIDGVRENPDDPDSLISIITIEKIYELINKGIISGGMIPKVMGCIEAINKGVKTTHILNGTIPHPIILEIFTDKGIGSMVVK